MKISNELCNLGQKNLPRSKFTPVLALAVSLWFLPMQVQAEAADFNVSDASTQHGVARSNASSASTTIARQTLRIGYLADAESQPPWRTGAIKRAIRDAQADGLLVGYNITLFVNVTPCESKSGTFDAMHLLGEQKVDVLFGPTCSLACTAAGYIASYYNSPYFPEWCRDSIMDNSTTFNTLIRMAGSWTSLGLAVKSVMNYYGWRRLVLLSDNVDDTCFYGATSINKVLAMPSDDNAINVYWIWMSNQPSDVDIDDYLQQTALRARIVAFCHTDALVMQRLLFKAQDKKMTGGDYAIFIFGDVSLLWAVRPLDLFNFTGLVDFDYRLRLLTAVKQIVIDDFDLVSNDSSTTKQTESTVLSNYLHDAVYVYLTAADKLRRQGMDYINGTSIHRAIVNSTYTGDSGTVYFDKEGDRMTAYALLSYDYEKNVYYKYMNVNPLSSSQAISVVNSVKWGFSDVVPRDTPACGFTNELCMSPKQSGTTILAIVAGVTIFLLLVFGKIFQVYRTKTAEARVRKMLWQVHFDDIAIIKPSERIGSCAGHLHPEDYPKTSMQNVHAIFKGSTVAVQFLDETKSNLSENDLFELLNLKELNHDNIRSFVGACIDPGRTCFLLQCCTRGSIQELIKNSEVKLDKFFRISLISDLANGMQYLHKSIFQSHGQLTSARCLVDSRWVLKVDGFGLHGIRDRITIDKSGENAYYYEMLWTAPELLRMKHRPLKGTQKGDVYSFAIIVQEIAYMAPPYFIDKDDKEPKQIIQKVKDTSPPFYRPTVPSSTESDVNPSIIALMRKCWSEMPTDRITFDEVAKCLRKLNDGKKFNIVDNMLQKLEKYANNLEDLVQQRTSELTEEKKKTDRLLYQLLPPYVAEELKAGRQVEPRMYDSVTIYFSDIVGFTTLSSSSTPFEVVNLLNDLYTMFDDTISNHDVYKVETIGDAYMVVSGLPQPNGGKHICEICNTALDLLKGILQFKIRHRPEENLRLRIGIHTGPCAAGVVGHRMPRYCLFGDTVNVASRMESTGEAMRIHLSESATVALSTFGGYLVEPRDPANGTIIKGKGLMKTFWLLRKVDGDVVTES